MSETVSRVPTRPADQELPALERENRLLRQENERLHAVDEQLRESLSMLEATADGMVVVDLSGKIKGFNRQFQRIWGIPDAILETRRREDAAAFVLDQLKDPDVFEAKRKEFRDKPGAEIFELLEFKDGRVLECHSQPQVIGDRVVGRVWNFRDITERREAEKRLTYLASFPERNPNPILEVDLDGHVRYANPAALHLFPDLHEQDRAHPWLVDWATVVCSLREGQTDTRDVTIGGRRYQQLFHSFVQDGFVRIYGVDITEREEAQERFARQHRELQQVLDSVVAQIWYLDTEGRVVNCNSAACEASGVPLGEMRGQTILTLAPTWDDPQRRHQQTLAVARTGQPLLGSIESFRVNDEVRWVSVDKVPWRDADQAIMGVLLFIYDITDLKRAEKVQTQLLQKLSQINEELSHFAYVVSHDLKAPLRGIKLITEWLYEDYGDKLGEEAKEQMTLLQSRVNRMHNLIDGVLQYSRVGRIKEEIVPVNLNELIPMILDAIAPPEHVQITVDGNLPTIACEKTRITQVFQNLLTNAVKFMDKPKGEIRVRCVEETGFWKFGITDNGPGIEEKHFERIFRIFQTLAPKDEYESTGVGLTLVKKIVELYGGRVWVESEVGKGSTFFFTFPKPTEKVMDETLPTCAVGS